MTYFYTLLALFAGSVLLARWQYSRAHSMWRYLWYQHWGVRQKQRAFSRWLWARYPRFMRFKWRVTAPYYRLKHHDLTWKIRIKLDHWWFLYAHFWVPKCKHHPKVMLMAGTCMACMARKVGEEQNRKAKLANLTGKGDGKDPLPPDFLEKMFGG